MIKNSSLSAIKRLAESIALEFPEFIIPLDLIVKVEELTLLYNSYGDALTESKKKI